VVVDECHHVPAAAFEQAIRQVPARRWLGLTATPYRRDKLDDLIALQLGPVRHTMRAEARAATLADGLDNGSGGAVLPAPEPVLRLHPTGFRYVGDADPSAPGGMAAIYRDLVADEARAKQIVADVVCALDRGRHCLILTLWRAHVDHIAKALRDQGRDPVVLRGGMGAKARTAALTRLRSAPDTSPLLVVATGPYVGEGFDCPAPGHRVSWPPPSRSRDVWSSTPGACCDLIRGRSARKCTTITTSRPVSSPLPWPGALPATPASASPIHVGCSSTTAQRE
jgi:hypothetical protein